MSTRLTLYMLLCWISLIIPATKINANDFDAVKQLAARRVPWLANNLLLKKISADKGELFVLQTQNNKIQISATNANAAATGLNWYLKYYCHRSMSHMGDNLSPVNSLPVIKEPVTINAATQYRYALNYCTYNYTMSFYTWNDWERELDWMALNGVNLMLIANGEEAVWQNVLRRIGFTEKEITDFITGPSYNAWWLMGNLEKWGGPMPQSQIDSRKRMVQKMIGRMRELGIEPVMPAFYGMVPHNLHEKLKAHIIRQGNWISFTRPSILDPTDSTFNRIAGLFYEETKKLYGSDIRFFSGDPFHEGGITEGIDLAKAGLNIQRAMQQHFPGSIWVLQGWLDNPSKALLSETDKSHLLIQELAGENTNDWERRNGFEGTPFIWCTVTNFGERPGINGKLQRFATEVNRASTGKFSQYMKGVGIMPEGINNNPVAYDLLLELAWHKEQLDVPNWLKNYVQARYGKYNKNIEEAWQLFLQTAYSNPGRQTGAPENILCARPGLDIKFTSTWGSVNKGYDTAKYAEAVKIFAKALPQFKNSETYKIDLINFTKQILANRADIVYENIQKAYKEKDVTAFDKAAGHFLQLHTLTNELAGTHEFFRLTTYQQQALQGGNTSVEKKNNLKNAMMLITFWGGHDRNEDLLHEYAYKEWSGMMLTYYKKRWEMYFDYLRNNMKGIDSTAPDYFAWERNWVTQNVVIRQENIRSSMETIVKKILN